jgi:Ca2+-binding RTX toxin-like protein
MGGEQRRFIWSRRRRPALGAIAVATAALAALAPSAGASTLKIQGTDQIQYTAVAGETNNLAISFTGSAYRFQDAPGITITPTAPCTAAANVGTCPATGIDDLRANLGDLNDAGAVDASVAFPVTSVALDGGGGNDALTGAPNVHTQMSGDGSGTPGNDVLTGGTRDDSLNGGGGNDTMTGGLGDDRFFPGDGNDTVDAGPGDDDLNPNGGSLPDGADVWSGGPGEDFFDADRLTVGTAVSLNDAADDGIGCPGPSCEGDNVKSDIENVRSGFGDDVLVGSAQANDLAPGSGNDTVDGGAGSDGLNGDDGNDTVNGGPGNDFVGDGVGTDVVQGGAGDDEIFPAFGDDGSDVFGGGAGSDVLDASEGCCALGGVKVSLDGKANDGFLAADLSSPLDNVMGDVETVLGSGSSDILIGSKGPNELVGNGGADRIVGGAGADGLIGGLGRDVLAGGKGADEIDGGGGRDRLLARDHKADDLRCGSSVDTVKADRVDRFGPDCDKVALPGRKRG